MKHKASTAAEPASAAAHQPGSPRSAEEQERLEHALRELWERTITFNQTLGVQVVSVDPSAPQIRFDMRPEFVGHYLYDRLHGGVISAVLDVMGGFTLMCAIAEKHKEETTEQVMHRFSRLGTIDLRVDYLRPGNGKHFIASARVTRLGGRIGSTGSAAYVIS
jgi:uncharacterized protein (TIGR00369 family)